MNYLFFDLECGSCTGGGKVCEFGYVLTDDRLNVLEEANLLINPALYSGEWDWYALKKVLTHSRYEYEAQKKFPFYVKKICSLFNNAVAVGHTIDGDAQYLLDECSRYSLGAWDYRYVDLKLIDMIIHADESGRSLSKIAEEYGCSAEAYHDALTDAKTGLFICREWVKSYQVVPSDFFAAYPSAWGEVLERRIFLTRSGRLVERGVLVPERHNDLRGANKKIYRLFLAKYRAGKSSGKLRGKAVCLDSDYTDCHYKESLYLAKRIIDCGGRMANGVAHCDLFVALPHNLLYKPSVEGEGKTFEILPFAAFLERIGENEERLEEVSVPNLGFLSRFATIRTEEEIEMFLKTKNRQKNKVDF